MKKLGTKSINIDSETHKEIRVKAAETEADMNAVMAEAWAAYKREKLRREPLPADQDLIQRLLRLWYEPAGMEVALRRMIAIAIELPVPDDGRHHPFEGKS